jgi:uncharacterized phage protein gp47/JayE
MATINFPSSRKEVADRASTDVQSELPTSQPFLRRSYLRALIVGYAGRVYDFYLQLKQLLFQMFVDTATGDFLIRWGGYVNINPNAATQSTGGIVLVGTASTVVDVDTVFTVNGLEYNTLSSVTLALQTISITNLARSGATVTAATASAHNLASNLSITIAGAVETDYNGDFTITTTSETTFTYEISTTPSTPAAGTITASYTGSPVDVESVDFGIDTNQDSGTSLGVQTPISGLDSTAFVQFDGLTGGADVEDTSDYRDRVLFRYQNPHALFNENEIITQSKKVAGVTRVWVEPITPVVGAVTVYFTRDNDENIIPSAGEIEAVYNNLLEILPANTDPTDLHVEAPTPVPVNFTFTALSPDNSSMREAITDNLTLLFKEGTNEGVNLLSDDYRCSIKQSIDEFGDPVSSYTLSSPVGDVSISAGQLPTLGTITFP